MLSPVLLHIICYVRELCEYAKKSGEGNSGLQGCRFSFCYIICFYN